MPTNLAVDDKLIDEARRIGKHKVNNPAIRVRGLQEQRHAMFPHSGR